MDYGVDIMRQEVLFTLLKRCNDVGYKVNRESLQYLVYILQIMSDVNVGYNFKLSEFGPITELVQSDLDVMIEYGRVQEKKDDGDNYYLYVPYDNIIKLSDVRMDAIEKLIEYYMALLFDELYLRFMITFLADKARREERPMNRNQICDTIVEMNVSQNKREIRAVFDELLSRDYI